MLLAFRCLSDPRREARQPFTGGRSPGKERSQTQTLLLVLSHITHCVCCSSRWKPTWREHSHMRMKHKLAEAVFRSRDRLAHGASPLLVQLFCPTHGRQARTFNSQEKHTHPTFSFAPNTNTPARKGMLDSSWPEKLAFLMAPVSLLRS